MMIKLALAFGMDCLFGDPLWLYHPIRVIGKWIAGLEKWLRRWVSCRKAGRKGRRTLSDGCYGTAVFLAALGNLKGRGTDTSMAGLCSGSFLDVSDSCNEELADGIHEGFRCIDAEGHHQGTADAFMACRPGYGTSFGSGSD